MSVTWKKTISNQNNQLRRSWWHGLLFLSLFVVWFFKTGFLCVTALAVLELTLEISRPGWRWTHRYPPASASQVLGLKAWATTTRLVAHIYNPRTQEALERSLQVQCQPELHWKFEVNLGYTVRSYPRFKKKKNWGIYLSGITLAWYYVQPQYHKTQSWFYRPVILGIQKLRQDDHTRLTWSIGGRVGFQG